jgi:hypothetical protein
MGRSISDETCHQQMIFAISSCHDNQQCIDKIIDFAHHHLMTKPCRNVSGAQQLMKPAFSAHLLEMKTPTNPATRQMALHAPIQYNNEMLSRSPSGRQKTSAHQNDIVWTLFDPLSTIFIHS